ncbi:thioredoxin-disulfide reductase [bacterium]|nr:thioredoxin-disulfide reductase [bacterium]
MVTEKITRLRQAIVGSGAAGLTAAIYSARAGLEPLVFEGDLPGGQLTTTTEVENFPGFENGIQGPELMDTLKRQAARFGATFAPRGIESVDFSADRLLLKSDQDSWQAESVIIATGASPRLLGLPSERRFMGRGVSTCATCDAFFYRGKRVAVVGGGDSAMEEVSFIARFASEVALIHRRSEFRASKIMIERVRSNPKIEIIRDSVVEEVLGDDARGVYAVRLKNVKSGQTSERELDGIFMAIGHTPNSQPFAGQVEMDAEGYILTFDGTMTSVPGVFAAGDVVDHRYRQAITAAGMGCRASLDAEKWLAARE